ncbi:MAG: serine/threonine protein kinase [Pirellulales bacterium]
MSLASQMYFGPYRVLNILMTGRTSQVCEVMDDKRQQRFAVKTLLSEFRRDKEQVGFLKHEYLVGSKMHHDRVIRIYEFGIDRGNPYLLMELFPVQNMKWFILRGVERIAHLLPKIIEQAAEGLAYFHEQGWIHRDVKPDNFLMSPEGEVKLIDFALAWRRQGAFGQLFSGKPKIQGTRSYISPEQIRRQPLDFRSDVYSFGCMLHELVSGKPPYTASSANELLVKHLKAVAPSLDAVHRNVNPQFAQLVRSMLAKNPKARPDAMAQFLQDFRAIRMFKEMPTAETEKKKQRDLRDR